MPCLLDLSISRYSKRVADIKESKEHAIANRYSRGMCLEGLG